MLNSTFVTLVDAGVCYRDDHELWGALLVRGADGHTKLYAQYLPQASHPNPPGWSALAELIGVSADDIIRGWDLSGNYNPVAVTAFDILKARIGEDFIGREIPGVEEALALELIPVRVEAATREAAQAQAFPPPAPRYTRLTQISQQIDPNRQAPAVLLIESEHAPPLAILIPDREGVADPPDWRFVEAIAQIPASKVAVSWTQPGLVRENKYVTEAVRILVQIAGACLAPLTPEGLLDLAGLRQALIRGRHVKPAVFLDRDPEQATTDAWTLLKDAAGVRLFRYNVERGANSGIPAVVRTVDAYHKLEVLNVADKMRGLVQRSMIFVKPLKGFAVSHHTAPDTLLNDMVYFPDQTVPAIDAIVRIPTVRPDGTIHDTAGYDATSRIWYAPELQLEDVPMRPNDSDMRRALQTIITPFRQFPFVEQSGALAAMMACLLDQVVRPMISGPRPLYAFDAPALFGQGSGKTLIAQALSAIVTGREVGVTPWPEDPKELPKIITSKLLAGELFVVFDNLTGIVSNKDLAACATSTVWSARLLHKNDSPKLPQVGTWCLTLNGGRFSRDIARRVVMVRLDARVLNPFRRSGFDLKNLVTWCIHKRAPIIHACLVLVRSWVAAGRPVDPALHFGSYEAWQDVVGGILYNAGIQNLSRALEEATSRDVDAPEHEEFVARWAATFNTMPVTAVQLAGLAEAFSLYGSVLEGVRASAWKGRHMAGILQKLDGHVLNGWRVTRDAKRIDGYFMFRLIKEV